MDKKKLAIDLFKIGAIKFGQFKLKSGLISPIYIDLRLLISYPKVMKNVAKAYAVMMKKLKYDRMIAIPYAAIPIVSAISILNNKPYIYTRKEVKEYGTKKLIEGEFRKGEKAVLIDDLITTGLSKIEIIKPIELGGLTVKEIVVLIDREQGGKKELEEKGYRLHSALTMMEILEILLKSKKISKEKFTEVENFISK